MKDCKVPLFQGCGRALFRNRNAARPTIISGLPKKGICAPEQMLHIAVALALGVDPSRPDNPWWLGAAIRQRKDSRTARDAPAPQYDGDARAPMQDSLPWHFVDAASMPFPRSRCTARCNGHFTSVIVYNNTNRAGLSDRMKLFSHMRRLADGLCAQLAIHRPWRMLSLDHNGDRELNRSFWWDRYFSIEELSHGGLMDAAEVVPANVTIGPSFYTVVEDLETAQRTVAKGKPFVWSIGANFFDWWRSDDILPRLGKLCEAEWAVYRDFGSYQVERTRRPPPSWCANGLRPSGSGASEVCCADICGQCGGQGCKLAPGGFDACCIESILAANITCTSAGQTGCLVPPDGSKPQDASDVAGSAGQVLVRQTAQRVTAHLEDMGGAGCTRRSTPGLPRLGFMREAEMKAELDDMEAWLKEERLGFLRSVRQEDEEDELEDGCGGLHVLHIRRGETVAQCNTSAQAVTAFMSCPRFETDRNSSDRLVIFTDETDQHYLAKVVRDLAQLPRWGGGVWLGDPLIAKQLSKEDAHDNYLIYTVLFCPPRAG